jgi:Zn-dependent M28 family amino/carboxypeptidase
MDAITEKIVDKTGADGAPMPDFAAICDTGGRFAGSESEGAACEYLARRLKELTGAEPVRAVVDDLGWTRGEASIERLDGVGGTFPCVSLVRSPATPSAGLDAELVDLGRGAEADFIAHAAEIPGNIVMVRHEYMFTAGTIHRRRKYQWAMDQGAAGFLIACHLPGDLPVTGSSGATAERGIPAAGISAETAAALAAGGRARLKFRIAAEQAPRRTQNLILDLPGRTPEWVVLSAHIDGHHLAESAMDNATGLAAALAVTGAVAPHVETFQRGLRVALFNVEEWALSGSAHYVDGLSEAERAAIRLNVNLDSIAGSPNLTALTSGFPAAEAWLVKRARAHGRMLGAYRPLMANSDHYNFARHGISAARVVAGFDEPQSNLRYVLTPGDDRSKVVARDLTAAARLIAGLVADACRAPHLRLR